MCVRNTTRGTTLAKTLITLNDNFQGTLRHLLANGFPRNCALWISPCHCISTMGMKEPIDIAFLDQEGRVVKVFRNLPPNYFVDSTPETVSAIELPSNRLSETKTASGDKLALEPS